VALVHCTLGMHLLAVPHRAWQALLSSQTCDWQLLLHNTTLKHLLLHNHKE
jgi:hypothetical protein